MVDAGDALRGWNDLEIISLVETYLDRTTGTAHFTLESVDDWFTLHRFVFGNPPGVDTTVESDSTS